MPPVSPARISLPDRYRVVRHLASGGMAAVWEAHDELLDRDVAVKILAPHLGEDERARRRFQREARAAAGLSSHPHVVTIYDVGEHAGRVFMVMEIMRGGTLRDRLKSGREISFETVARWMREAAEALDAADEAGVVHRDIKPGNLLLDGQERLAVADFGIARVAWEDQLTLTGQVLGTAAYISPEQAMGEPATAASDRYSLAVVAYELLTGSRPFEGSHFAVQARAHVEDPPPPPSSRNPELSAAVDAVLERALAKDPRDRYGSAAEFAAALARALDEPRTAPTRRLGRRGAGAAGAAAASGAAAPPASGNAPRRCDIAAAPSATDEWRRGAATGEGGRRRAGTDALAAAPAPRRRSSAALLAGVAGLLVVAVVGVVALASRGGGNDPSGGGTPQAQHTADPTKTASPDKTATASPTASASPSATATDTPAPDQTVSGAPDLKQAAALQLAGYNARQAGDYATALEKSRAALAACGDAHQLSPCGYALYEEGVALNRSGDSAAAIPILQQRLDQYGDDGTGSVAKELRDAQKRAGQKPAGGKGHRGKGPKDSRD
jgi:eukaryotic-like serine/threonine-protein kinase